MTAAPIDAVAWKSARPAARRVRAGGAGVALGLTVVTVVVAFSVGSLLLLLGAPLAGWVGWLAAHRVLAARAVGAVRRGSALSVLPATAVADLIARGRAQVGGSTVIAVEDADNVVLTTAPGAGRGPELPLSAITNLGRSDG